MVLELALVPPPARTRVAPGRTAVVYLPGLGPQAADGRIGAFLQRRETASLGRGADVWLLARRPDLSSGTTIADLAGDAADAIRATFADPVDVVALSTGGSIGLQLALDHPELVRRLVLVSAASRLGVDGRRTQRTIAGHLRAGHPRRAAAVMLASTAPQAWSRAVLVLAGLLLGRLVVGTTDDDLVAVIEAEDAFDAVPGPAAATRTLLVAGARDPYYRGGMVAATAVLLGTRALEVPRRGHISLATSRAARRAVRAFLTSTHPAGTTEELQQDPGAIPVPPKLLGPAHRPVRAVGSASSSRRRARRAAAALPRAAHR